MNPKFAEFRARLEANRKAREATEALKKKVKSTPAALFGSELKRANEDAKKLALLHAEEQWLTVGVLITGQHQYCSGCGHDALCTTGIYHIQKHSTFTAQRLKSTQTPDMRLEINRAIDPQDLTVTICANCAPDSHDPLTQLLETAAQTAPFITNQLSLF